MRDVQLRDHAMSDLSEWVYENPKLLRRIMRIIEECRKTPFEGIGKPEPLKGNLSGCWSRRISDEDRLVYEVTDDMIIIMSMKGHYK
jgi:toxin YoeB